MDKKKSEYETVFFLLPILPESFLPENIEENQLAQTTVDMDQEMTDEDERGIESGVRHPILPIPRRCKR